MTDPTAQKRPAGETTPAGRNLAEWFRQLDRYVRTVRTFGAASANALAARERALEDFLDVLRFHAPVVLHCTPLEIWLRDEAVVRPPGPLESETNIERRVPFLLYRDGVRSLTFSAGTTREDVAALVDALARVSTSQAAGEDVITILWEADLAGLRVDVAPLEQTLHARELPDPGQPPVPAPGTAAAPGASATRAAQPPAPEGFDDWPVPAAAADPIAEWQALREAEPAACAELLAAWKREHAEPWTQVMPRLVHEVLALDPGPDTQAALAHALVTWLGGAVQRCDWAEAARALATLAEADPEGEHSRGPLTSVLQVVDAEAIAARLDEAEPAEQAQFAAIGVRIGRPALDLMVGVLASATRVRLRAAATTALAYLCAEEPQALARYLGDERWYFVRNLVFVLGHIGGPAVVPFLADSARHPDARVRRAVVHALGQAPPEERVALLLELLESPDAQTVSAALAMLAREADPELAGALLERVTAPDFAERPDDVKSALIGALGDIDSEGVVPVLEQLLQKGGWFARRTAERTAAAHALARLGTHAARMVLHTGLESRSEAIRACCQEALARPRGRAA